MWPSVRWKPTLSVTFAMTLFTLNYHTVIGKRKDTIRRQRNLFNILSGIHVTTGANATEAQLDTESGVTSNDVENIRDPIKLIDSKHVLNPNATVDVDGKNGVANGDGNDDNRKNRPPLVSGKETIIVLPFLGKFRKTWCKAEPFMQVIKEPGCVTRKVVNRFCYGQCNSFYIPRTLRKGKKQNIFKSCGFCKPRRTHNIRVTLVCPGKRKGYKHKRVRQIKTCRCTASNTS